MSRVVRDVITFSGLVRLVKYFNDRGLLGFMVPAVVGHGLESCITRSLSEQQGIALLRPTPS
jgi:hypothetical protein